MNLKIITTALVAVVGLVFSCCASSDFQWLSPSEAVPLPGQWPIYSYQSENKITVVAREPGYRYSPGYLNSKTLIDGLWSESTYLGANGSTVFSGNKEKPVFILANPTSCGLYGCSSYIIEARYLINGFWGQPIRIASGEGYTNGLVATANEKYGVIVAWTHNGRIYSANLDGEGNVSDLAEIAVMAPLSYSANLSLATDSSNKSYLAWSARNGLDYS